MARWRERAQEDPFPDRQASDQDFIRARAATDGRLMAEQHRIGAVPPADSPSGRPLHRRGRGTEASFLALDVVPQQSYANIQALRCAIATSGADAARLALTAGWTSSGRAGADQYSTYTLYGAPLVSSGQVSVATITRPCPAASAPTTGTLTVSADLTNTGPWRA